MLQTLRDRIEPWIKTSGRREEVVELAPRRLFVITAALYFVALAATSVVPDDRFTVGAWLPLPVMALTGFVAYRLTGRRLPLAEIVWQTGLAASVAIALISTRQAAVVLSLVWLPMMAVLFTGALGVAESTIVSFAEDTTRMKSARRARLHA